ncbi:MAG: putative phage tail assembly chaperone [Pseudodesulfovibrio sp.]|nr:putative phage tail assembly chaperone [Pseudodesulfovibrio sp.]
MEKTIVLTINGTDITFNMTAKDHTAYVNEVMPSNKVAPAHNLLMRTVSSDSKDALKELLKLPGMAINVTAKLMEEFTPDIVITVGKSSKSPNE